MSWLSKIVTPTDWDARQAELVGEFYRVCDYDPDADDTGQAKKWAAERVKQEREVHAHTFLGWVEQLVA